MQVLQPAIELAENGFPVGPLTAAQWARGMKVLRRVGFCRCSLHLPCSPCWI